MFFKPRKQLFDVLTIAFITGGVIVGGMFARFILRDDVSDFALYYKDTPLLTFGDGVFAAILGGVFAFCAFSIAGIILAFAVQIIADKLRNT